MFVPVYQRHKVRIGEKLVVITKGKTFVVLNGDNVTFPVTNDDNLELGSKVFVTSDYELVPKLTLKVMVAKTKSLFNAFKHN